MGTGFMPLDMSAKFPVKCGVYVCSYCLTFPLLGTPHCLPPHPIQAMAKRHIYKHVRMQC